jgi:hypothetical protein
MKLLIPFLILAFAVILVGTGSYFDAQKINKLEIRVSKLESIKPVRFNDTTFYHKKDRIDTIIVINH